MTASKDPNNLDIVAIKKTAQVQLSLLKKYYPHATCALNFENPFQLLVATILSAQCTDERVNKVTPQLFSRFPRAQDLAQAAQSEIESIIQSTGFFRNKAKNLKACCQKLVADFNGQIPQSLDELVTLPGVGRKTGNVVLGTAFGISSGIVVDTHVARLSRRLGLTRAKDASKIEADLQKRIAKKSWIDFSHLLIHHGRKVCKARRPDCSRCFLEDCCPRILK